MLLLLFQQYSIRSDVWYEQESLCINLLIDPFPHSTELFNTIQHNYFFIQHNITEHILYVLSTGEANSKEGLHGPWLHMLIWIPNGSCATKSINQKLNWKANLSGFVSCAALNTALWASRPVLHTPYICQNGFSCPFVPFFMFLPHLDLYSLISFILLTDCSLWGSKELMSKSEGQNSDWPGSCGGHCRLSWWKMWRRGGNELLPKSRTHSNHWEEIRCVTR